MQSAEYTFFVIYITSMVFVAAVYVFAYRFLDNKFYLIIGLGWFVNALYLTAEAYDKYILTDTSKQFGSLKFIILTTSLLSTIVFHYALSRDRGFIENAGVLRRFKPWWGLLPITLCVYGIWSASQTNEIGHKWLYASFLVPTVLYSFAVLILIAYRFYAVFPEDAFSSKILYGTWGLYAIMQFFYPLSIFGENLSIAIFGTGLFVAAWLLKITNTVGLLNALRTEFSDAQEARKQFSIHKELGEIAAGLHHDLKELPGIIDGELTILERHGIDDARVSSAIKEVRVANRMISETVKLVDMMKLDPQNVLAKFKKLHVGTLISSTRGFFNKAVKGSHLRLVSPQPASSTLYVNVNEEIIVQAFFNIIKNAMESLATVVEIVVHRPAPKAPEVEFLFLNNGESISDEEIANCFRAGWTSEKKRERRTNSKADIGNVGMGLYMCSRMVSIHYGRIEIFNITKFNDASIPISKELRTKYNVGVRVTFPIARN